MSDELSSVELPKTGDSASGSDPLSDTAPALTVVDLYSRVTVSGPGAQWSLRGDRDLDANLVQLAPGGRIGEHVNSEVDVLMVGVAGSGWIRVDGRSVGLQPGTLAFVRRHARRSVSAGEGGVMYLTVHRRRKGLTIGSARAGESGEPTTIASGPPNLGGSER